MEVITPSTMQQIMIVRAKLEEIFFSILMNSPLFFPFDGFSCCLLLFSLCINAPVPGNLIESFQVMIYPYYVYLRSTIFFIKYYSTIRQH